MSFFTIPTFFISILWILLAQEVTQSRGQNLFPAMINFTQQGQEKVSPIPQVDLLGTLANIFDRFMTRATRDHPPPKSDLCNGQLLQIGENEIKVSQQPRGLCSYCCRLTKPSKYVRIFFTSKQSGGKVVELKMSKSPGALGSAGVNSSLPTVVFIHGFTEHGQGPCPRIIKDAYLSIDQDYNIFLVDWGDLTTFPWYPQAAQNTKLVGTILAKFLNFYNGTGELPLANVHLVGFSLGAHIAGFAGKFFQGHQKIPRITGLDPALPLFPVNDSSQRLARTDADFVDVIHTSAGVYGFPKSLGHADFYPNGGRVIQPGCDASTLAEQKNIDEYVWCSHVRAWRLYAESVKNPTAFPATKCGILREGSFKQCRFSTEGFMGFAASKITTQGDFYLTTNNRNPFSKSAEEQEENMTRVNLIL